jgi:hypothetical protein
LSLALGAALGTAFGVGAGHVGAWLGIGVGIGMALGVFCWRKELPLLHRDDMHPLNEDLKTKN